MRSIPLHGLFSPLGRYAVPCALPIHWPCEPPYAPTSHVVAATSFPTTMCHTAYLVLMSNVVYERRKGLLPGFLLAAHFAISVKFKDFSA